MMKDQFDDRYFFTLRYFYFNIKANQGLNNNYSKMTQTALLILFDLTETSIGSEN